MIKNHFGITDKKGRFRYFKPTQRDPRFWQGGGNHLGEAWIGAQYKRDSKGRKTTIYCFDGTVLRKRWWNFWWEVWK